MPNFGYFQYNILYKMPKLCKSCCPIIGAFLTVFHLKRLIFQTSLKIHSPFYNTNSFLTNIAIILPFTLIYQVFKFH